MVQQVNSANVVASALMRKPDSGTKLCCIKLDFSGGATQSLDITPIMQQGVFESLASIWIDNSQNFSTLTVTFPNSDFSIVAQPLSQGWYAVALESAATVLNFAGVQGLNIPIRLCNATVPYVTFGQFPGVLVVPALVNSTPKFTPLTVGDNILVAAVAAKIVRAYRLIINVDAPTNLEFFDGASAGGLNIGGAYFLTAGGSLTMEASGVPWLTTSAGNGLIMKSSAAVNSGGNLGVTQQ